MSNFLMNRIKKGYPFEVELLCGVLSNLLTDFFPPSEIMTKVIGEFLSTQQPHPRLLAAVVFQVTRTPWFSGENFYIEVALCCKPNFSLKWIKLMKYCIVNVSLVFCCLGFWVCLWAVSAATSTRLGCAQCCQLHTVLSSWHGLMVPHLLFHQCIHQSMASGSVSFSCKHSKLFARIWYILNKIQGSNNISV